VAGTAVQRGVSSEQRKAVLVLVDLLHGNLPALDGVALFAAGTELAFMDVGVTICALTPHVGKYRFDMALRAGDLLMHTAQREAGLVVVELWHAADRLPSAKRVAVLAENIQVAVRAAGLGVRLRLSPRRRGRSKEQERNKQINSDRRNQRKTACIGFAPNHRTKDNECNNLSTWNLSTYAIRSLRSNSDRGYGPHSENYLRAGHLHHQPRDVSFRQAQTIHISQVRLCICGRAKAGVLFL